MPMTVVISKFNRAYEHESRQTEKLVLLDSPSERGQASPSGGMRRGREHFSNTPIASHYPPLTRHNVLTFPTNGHASNGNCMSTNLLYDHCFGLGDKLLFERILGEQGSCELYNEFNSQIELEKHHCTCKCNGTKAFSLENFTLLKKDGLKKADSNGCM